MALTEVLVKEGAKKLLKKATSLGSKAIPGLGTAVTATELIGAWADKKHEEVRDQARQRLNCNHIEVCPKMNLANTPTSDMVQYAYERGGMAFRYNGFALCHHQADLDVKILSTEVYRWDGKLVIPGNGKMHIKPCDICSRRKMKDGKVST